VLTPPYKVSCYETSHKGNYVRWPRFFRNCRAMAEGEDSRTERPEDFHDSPLSFFTTQRPTSCNSLSMAVCCSLLHAFFGHMPLHNKGKVKLSLYLTKHHAMKAYWGSGGAAPCISIGARWWWMVSFTSRYPLDRRLGGTQSRSGRGGGGKTDKMSWHLACVQTS
jgi:hypothetical protein